jgi:hypothetical protein
LEHDHQIAVEGWRQHGFDVNFGNLTYSHERNDAEKHLQGADGTLPLGGWPTFSPLPGCQPGKWIPVRTDKAIHYLTATRT